MSVLRVFMVCISHIWTEYEEIPSIFPCSVWMRENADQNNSECGHFLRDEHYYNNEFAWSSSLFFFHVERVYFGMSTHPTTSLIYLFPVITLKNFLVYSVCYIFTTHFRIARNFLFKTFFIETKSEVIFNL